MTKTEIATLIKTNLNDPRIYGIRLLLESLIERKTYGEGIEQYRFFKLVPNVDPLVEPTKTYLTSVDELMLEVTEANITVSHGFGRLTHNDSKPLSFFVMLDNVKLELDPMSKEDDREYRGIVGGTNKRLEFTLSYVNDNDDLLPVKVINLNMR